MITSQMSVPLSQYIPVTRNTLKHFKLSRNTFYYLIHQYNLEANEI